MSRSRSNRGRRGALLLEVVVALAVLVASMGLLGAQLVGGLNMVEYAEDQLQAGLLADRILGLVQLDPEMYRVMLEEEQLEYPFSDDNALGYSLGNYPGYFWRITLEQIDRDTELEDIAIVKIEILKQRDRENLDSIEGATLVRQLVLIKTAAGRIDLAEDLGMSEGLIDQVRQMIPIEDFDPSSVNLQELVQYLDEDTLMTLLPMLTSLWSQVGGSAGGLDGLKGLVGQLGGGDKFDEGVLGDLPPEASDALDKLRGMAGDGGGGPRGGPEAQPDGGDGSGLPPRPEAGGGSGPGGRYTIEDLMRMREEHQRKRGGR